MYQLAICRRSNCVTAKFQLRISSWPFTGGKLHRLMNKDDEYSRGRDLIRLLSEINIGLLKKIYDTWWCAWQMYSDGTSLFRCSSRLRQRQDLIFLNHPAEYVDRRALYPWQTTTSSSPNDSAVRLTLPRDLTFGSVNHYNLAHRCSFNASSAPILDKND